ncbi:MAG: alpha/beta fold hydrolase [Firmicutes bacterium]|nr:alpha/beta fold hydrolase [Bacillota bacterium]
MKRKILALTLTVLMAASNVMAADVVVNNTKIDTEAVIEGGRTLVPVRGVFEQLGFSVDWDADAGKAELSDSTRTITIIKGGNTFTVNNETVTPDVPQQIINDRFYIPLRAISEAIGADVAWDAETKTAKITYNETSAEVKTEDTLPTYEFTEIPTEVKNTTTGNTLRGTLYKPETEGKMPIAICAHEFGSNSRRRWPAYGQSLASHGMAVYAFDFSGGGNESQSDGSSLDMSVMTEVTDLESVLTEVQTWDFVDTDRIVIIGGSQGGAVSAITAARHEDDINGLVLLYPALIIQDDLHVKFENKEDCPEVYSYNGWINVGKRYVEDMWDYDIYAEMGNYTKPVLILHGDNDDIVPYSYSERARDIYPDAELYTIEGGVHGFQDETFDAAMVHIYDYLTENNLINK